MKLFVIGATGRTGREVVEQALTRGHQVTALRGTSSSCPRYWPNFAILIVMSALLFAFCASRFRTKIA